MSSYHHVMHHVFQEQERRDMEHSLSQLRIQHDTEKREIHNTWQTTMDGKIAELKATTCSHEVVEAKVKGEWMSTCRHVGYVIHMSCHGFVVCHVMLCDVINMACPHVVPISSCHVISSSPC